MVRTLRLPVVVTAEVLALSVLVTVRSRVPPTRALVRVRLDRVCVVVLVPV